MHNIRLALLSWIGTAAVLLVNLSCDTGASKYVGRWECSSGGGDFFEIKENNDEFLVTDETGATYPASVDDKDTLVVSGVPLMGSLPLPIDSDSGELICSACSCNRYARKDASASTQSAVPEAASEPDTDAPQATAQPITPLQEASVSRMDDGSVQAKDSLLESITDPEIAAHLTRQIRRTSLDRDPIVVVDLDGQKVWINLKGRDIEIPLEELEGDPDNVEVGNKFSRKFRKNDVSLLLQYEVLSSFTNQEMGCQRTDYRLSIDLSSNYGGERVEPESYGEGC